MHVACNPLDYINDSCDSPMSSSISDNIFNSSEHMIQIRNDKFLTKGLFRVVLAFNLEPFHDWFHTHSLQHGSFYQFPGFQSASKSPVSPDLDERSEKYSNDSCTEHIFDGRDILKTCQLAQRKCNSTTKTSISHNKLIHITNSIKTTQIQQKCQGIH